MPLGGLNLKTSSDGHLVVYGGEEWRYRVQSGQIPGMSVVDKFGENPVIETTTDPEDVWEGGSIYTFSTTADIDTLSSSNAADVGQLIRIQGIAGDGTLQFGYAITNGQNKVLIYDNEALTGDPISFLRVFRMENEAATGGDLSGILYCYVDGAITGGVPNDPSTIRAIINNGNNQTLMALYTIPLGYVGFLFRGELGVSKSGGVAAEAICMYQSRRYGKLFKIKKRVNLSTSGSSIFQDARAFPDPIPALTDIKLTVSEVSATLGIFGTFDILLVEEGLLSSEFLSAIGQPSSV